MGAVPRQIRACEKNGISPIFAIEFYIQPGHKDKQSFTAMDAEQKKSIRKSYHLLAIAYNQTGYKNLVNLSSWAWIEGFYYRPRVNYEILQKHKEGVIFTSCCYNSEIGQAFEHGGKEAADEMIRRYVGMFGDNFYLEIMLLDFSKQKPYDAYIVDAASRFNLPIILTQDCFVPGTLILTDSGYKTIENINVGDMVYTHKNRFKKVEVVASRALKENEKVYRVKSNVGTYLFEATGNHKMYVVSKNDDVFSFQWKKVDELNKKDYLLVPKYNKDLFFNKDDTKYIDLFDFLEEGVDYKLSDGEYKNKKNFLCQTYYDEKEKSIISYFRFDRKNTVKIPRFLEITDEFLKIIGWYIAEGWRDPNSFQVGFAFHENEMNVAKFVENYFNKFGIKSKIYKVSEKEISVKFSSKVFNRFFGKLCGTGCGNKHLPYINGTWVGKWSIRQILHVLHCWALGDGCNRKSFGREVYSFNSTSKGLIFEASTIFNSIGYLNFPSCRVHNGKNWKDLWVITLSGERANDVKKMFETNEVTQSSHSHFWHDFESYWGVQFIDKEEVNSYKVVYDMQVEEDHSFTANMITCSNCHYCLQEDSKYQRYMLMIQKDTTVHDIEKKLQADDKAEIFELQDTNLWMKSEEELNEKWAQMYQDVIPLDVFERAKENTVKICHKAKGIQIDRSIKLPQMPDANEKFKELIIKGFKWRNLKGRAYEMRLKEEYELITRKEFASYFLIQKQIIDEGRRAAPKIMSWPDWDDGHDAVGPGRGSCCGSLVCYCLGITDVDPIKHNLLFSRFLSEARGGKSIKLRFTQKPLAKAG